MTVSDLFNAMFIDTGVVIEEVLDLPVIVKMFESNANEWGEYRDLIAVFDKGRLLIEIG